MFGKYIYFIFVIRHFIPTGLLFPPVEGGTGERTRGGGEEDGGRGEEGGRKP